MHVIRNGRSDNRVVVTFAPWDTDILMNDNYFFSNCPRVKGRRVGRGCSVHVACTARREREAASCKCKYLVEIIVTKRHITRTLYSPPARLANRRRLRQATREYRESYLKKKKVYLSVSVDFRSTAFPRRAARIRRWIISFLLRESKEIGTG